MLEAKDIMEIIDEADCNAEACFTNSKGVYESLGWAKNLVRVAFKAGVGRERENWCSMGNNLLKDFPEASEFWLKLVNQIIFTVV